MAIVACTGGGHEHAVHRSTGGGSSGARSRHRGTERPQFVVSGKAAEQLQDFTTINLATAERIAEVCERLAAAESVGISIDVLDNDGNLVYMDRSWRRSSRITPDKSASAVSADGHRFEALARFTGVRSTKAGLRSVVKPQLRPTTSVVRTQSGDTAGCNCGLKTTIW
jgi:hypothetical protein